MANPRKKNATDLCCFRILPPVWIEITRFCRLFPHTFIIPSTLLPPFSAFHHASAYLVHAFCHASDPICALSDCRAVVGLVQTRLDDHSNNRHNEDFIHKHDDADLLWYLKGILRFNYHHVAIQWVLAHIDEPTNTCLLYTSPSPRDS